jgi:hypothetical protein
VSEFPALEASLLRAAHRRYGWRRWRPRVAVALVAAAAAGVILLVTRPPAPDDERAAVATWTTVSVPRYGVNVSLPAGWRLAGATLTPHLLDPHEILTAATFVPQRRDVRGCAMVPPIAVARNGAFVTVQERAAGMTAAPRPKRFTTQPTSPITAGIVRSCAPGTDAVSYLQFSDGMRSFDAFVAVAPGAPPAVRVQAFGILDRLRFDSGFVPWW